MRSSSGWSDIKTYYEHQAHVLHIFYYFFLALATLQSPTSCLNPKLTHWTAPPLFWYCFIWLTHTKSLTCHHLNLIFSSLSHFSSTFLKHITYRSWNSQSEETKETSGWCHVVRSPFQDWNQWGETSSFFPEYYPRFLAPLTESTVPALLSFLSALFSFLDIRNLKFPKRVRRLPTDQASVW